MIPDSCLMAALDDATATMPGVWILTVPGLFWTKVCSPLQITLNNKITLLLIDGYYWQGYHNNASSPYFYAYSPLCRSWLHLLTQPLVVLIKKIQSNHSQMSNRTYVVWEHTWFWRRDRKGGFWDGPFDRTPFHIECTQTQNPRETPQDEPGQGDPP